MNNASLALLMMLLTTAYGSINVDNTAFDSQAFTKTVSANQQGRAKSYQLAHVLADAATVPPAPASKAPPAKVKHVGAPPCSKQSADNHDAQVIPTGKKTQWPHSRPPSVQQKQCQPQKSLPKPPLVQR